MSDNNDRTNLSGRPDADTILGNGIWRKRNDAPSAPRLNQGPDPTGDDPFVEGSEEVSGGVEPLPLDDQERKVLKMQKHDPDGPSYEANQDPTDRTGGSTDPSDSLSFSDSGDESVRR